MDTVTDRNTPSPARLALLGALAAVASLQGCQKDNGAGQVVHGETFPADEEARAVDRFVQVQSAAAARTDPTLNASHFDGGRGLNSLGEQKLDLMLRDDDRRRPVVVYLDLPREAGTDGHREAVRAYLLDHGVGEGHIEFRSGPNVDYSHPAEDGLRGLRKLEGDAAPTDSGVDNGATNPVADMVKSPPAH